MSRYEDEYNKWVASLSPQERAKLKSQGLDKPLADEQSYNPDPTVAFETVSDEGFDYGAVDEKPSKEVVELIEQKSLEYGAQLLSWVFARLQAHKTEKSSNIDRDALVFALGMATLEGRTQTDIAKRYGITKAAFSVRVKSWQKLIGLKPSSFMKSEAACKSYRKARLEILTRRQSV